MLTQVRVVAFVLLASGCNASPGHFSVQFQWQDAPPPAAGTVEIVAEVLAPDGRITPAKPVVYAPGAQLVFDEVTNGDELRVEIRVYPLGPIEESAGPRYFGRSAPFALRPGVDIDVPVELDLVDGPDLLGEDPTAVRVLNANARGEVTTPNLELEVQARGAEFIEVAQNSTFSAAYRRFDTPSLSSVMSSSMPMAYEVAYDLDDSIDCASRACDGPRPIFVRVGREAFRSRAVFVDLTLDTIAPSIRFATVSYTPDTDNPLPMPAAARAGTRITVSLAFSERLDASQAPTMNATLGGRPLTFDLVPGSLTETGALFEAIVTPAMPDGVYRPTLSLRDSAGNERTDATFDTPEIAVNTTVEELYVNQSEVSYVRAPFGNAAPERLGDFTIPAGPRYFALAPSDGLGTAASLGPDTFMLSNGAEPAALRVWADDRRESLVSPLVLPHDDGWARTDLRLSNLDTPTVFVTGLDEAGNESEPVRIENAWLVASTAGASRGASPHRLSSSGRPTAPLEVFGVLDDRADVAGMDDRARLQPAEHTWHEKSGPAPSARDEAPMIYDSARGRTLMFGRGEGATLEVWSWNGSEWSDITAAAGGPEWRSGHAIAYDSRRDRVVLFGGYSIAFQLSDTWEWDGSGWIEKTPSSVPAARGGHTMAYDSARGRVVLFGGQDFLYTPYADTWEWDGEDWTQVTTPVSPPPRANHSMVYDVARGHSVIFGGTDVIAEDNLHDTWTWDGVQWTDVSAANAPSANDGHQMIYDSVRERVVLFGGTDYDTYTDRGETWEWDGAGWSNATALAGPNPRRDHAMAFDRARRRVVLFGGRDDDGERADLWELTTDGWSELTTSAERPPELGIEAMVYDPSRGRSVVVVGGSSPSIDTLQTWEWDGVRWTEVIPAGLLPPPRSFFGLTYDSARERVVLYGGLECSGPCTNPLSDIWEWDGSNWTDRTPTSGEAPPARYSPGVAYDRARSRFVLFGGLDASGATLDDTWEWDGSQWSNPTAPTGPPPRSEPAMAYDDDRDQVILFGGLESRPVAGASLDLLADTWVWDGSSWTNVTPSSGNPPDRAEAEMVYDAARRRPVMFGGVGPTGLLADLWEWDGNTWSQLIPDARRGPSGRYGHAMAYDSGRLRLVLRGGRGPEAIPKDTWELAAPQTSVIQHAIQLPDDLGLDQLTDIRVRASCGAIDMSGQGATLLGYATNGFGNPPGGWVELGASTAPVPIPATPRAGLIDFHPPTGSGSVTARNFFFEPGRHMYFQCASSFSLLALDYMEVRLGYATR